MTSKKTNYVALWVVWLCIASTATADTFGELSVVETDSGSNVFVTEFAQALFGPNVPLDSSWQSYVEEAVPREACRPINPPVLLGGSLAIIRRGGALGTCTFAEKVLRAQSAGFEGVIIYNDVDNEDIVNMNSLNETVNDKLNISAVFVTYQAGIFLRSYTNDTRYVVRFSKPFTDGSLVPYIIAMIVLLSIFVLLAVTFLISRWCLEVFRRRKSRLPKSALKKLPIKKYVKGDRYDCCAICLDDFEEGERLRILPCSHAYHQKCIDPWLVKSRRVCPVCKRKIFPRDARQPRGSDSESSDEDTDPGRSTATAGDSERTPLLSSSQQGSRGGRRAADTDSPSAATGSGMSPLGVANRDPLLQQSLDTETEGDLLVDHGRSAGSSSLAPRPRTVTPHTYVIDPQPNEDLEAGRPTTLDLRVTSLYGDSDDSDAMQVVTTRIKTPETRMVTPGTTDAALTPVGATQSGGESRAGGNGSGNDGRFSPAEPHALV